MIINKLKSGGSEPPSGEDAKDNSLLTPDNRVIGKVKGTLSQIRTADLLNEPAVYAICCKQNNKHYIGETKNLKDRIPRHYEHMDQDKSNAAFKDDMFKLGKDEFELIIVKSGAGCENSARKKLERELQAVLAPLGLCYNSTTSETKMARPEGKYPTSAGIYCIRCKINDARYYGETGQRKGQKKNKEIGETT